MWVIPSIACNRSWTSVASLHQHNEFHSGKQMPNFDTHYTLMMHRCDHCANAMRFQMGHTILIHSLKWPNFLAHLSRRKERIFSLWAPNLCDYLPKSSSFVSNILLPFIHSQSLFCLSSFSGHALKSKSQTDEIAFVFSRHLIIVTFM